MMEKKELDLETALKAVQWLRDNPTRWDQHRYVSNDGQRFCWAGAVLLVTGCTLDPAYSWYFPMWRDPQGRQTGILTLLAEAGVLPYDDDADTSVIGYLPEAHGASALDELERRVRAAYGPKLTTGQ